MEVIHPSVNAGQRSCPSCGEALAGKPRFCPSCGTEVRSPVVIPGPQPLVEPQSNVADSPVVSKSSSHGGKLWTMIVPLVATSLIIVLLAGSVVWLNGKLGTTKSALAGARGRVTNLNGKVSSLDSRLDTLKVEKSKLEAQNSSLTSAMVDCKDAASKTREIFRLLSQLRQGNASLDDLRAAGREADRAWFVCRTEANSNGAI
ncbi:MAG TPA: zinc ribbon domain-containing protein [Actinomycetota bacterium]